MLSLEEKTAIRSRKIKPSTVGDIILDILDLEITDELDMIVLGKELNLTQEETISMLKGDLAVTKEIATKLGNLFENGPESWIKLQEKFDYWMEYNKEKVVSVNQEFKTWSVT